MTFEEYQQIPNKKWWQITDRGYWDAGAASRDAEIAELVADAMRYRWLRDNKAKNNTHCWHFQNGPIIPGLLTLDSAIDAVAKREWP